MANCPTELKYTRSHEWLKTEDGLSVIGLTQFAVDALGDIVFIGLPEAGDEVKAGVSFADVESVKAVSDVFSPVSGKVAEVNEELLDSPEKLNEDPYGAWLIKVEATGETSELLDAAAYEAACAEEEA
jgi:glycine cleavage system H protein